jgi:hypothetical protein
MVSSNISRVTGTVIRNLREMTMTFHNRTDRWNKNGKVPSGWGHVKEPNLLKKVIHYTYEKMQFSDSPKPGSKK